MKAELGYFFAMVLYGFLGAACYHPLVFLRTVIRHTKAVTDAEDILFLMAAGFFFFLTAYTKNDGILRWYAFFGAGLGAVLYVRSFCVPLEAVRKWLLQKCGKTYKIKAKLRKGQVSADESNPEHRKKRKKKERP